MNKGDLINAIAEGAGISKAQASDALETVFGSIQEALKGGDKAAFVGFGTFSTSIRKARDGRNPLTGATIKIPRKTMVKFKPGKVLSHSIINSSIEGPDEDNSNISSIKTELRVNEELVKLTLKGNLEDFTIEKRKKFIKHLQNALGLDEDLQIISVKSGSIIIEIKLSKKNAKQLMKLLSTGSIDKNEFNIEKAEILNYKNEGPKINTQISKVIPLNSWKKKIKDKIAENDFSKVFTEFRTYIAPSESLYDDAVHLQARYNQKIKSNTLGIEDKEYFDREMNVIRYGMLNLVNNIKERHILKNTKYN